MPLASPDPHQLRILAGHRNSIEASWKVQPEWASLACDFAALTLGHALDGVAKDCRYEIAGLALMARCMLVEDNRFGNSKQAAVEALLQAKPNLATFMVEVLLCDDDEHFRLDLISCLGALGMRAELVRIAQSDPSAAARDSAMEWLHEPGCEQRRWSEYYRTVPVAGLEQPLIARKFASQLFSLREPPAESLVGSQDLHLILLTLITGLPNRRRSADASAGAIHIRRIRNAERSLEILDGIDSNLSEILRLSVS